MHYNTHIENEVATAAPRPGWRGRMGHEITILIGTMTGTAELVSDDVRDVLEAAGYRVVIEPMDDLTESIFSRGSTFLICTSTYGQGDVPDNAQAFFSSLQDARPDLSHVQYGLIALGDRTYKATYCGGGRRFDALLSELGATRLGEPLMHDAGSGTLPEDVAVDWVKRWADTWLAREVEVA
ncbi:nitric oxide synthase [bacterium]|nr:MAG: nitric oxide synthase [bacterium]